jgi:hypothetical protein
MNDVQAPTELDVQNIRRLLNLGPGDAEGEQRSCKRWSYPQKGLFAAYGNEKSVTHLAFFEVRFYDLSETGVSFLTRQPPLFKYGVVRLGDPPNAIFMLAEVRHCTARDDGSREYLVGCRFVRRL